VASTIDGMTIARHRAGQPASARTREASSATISVWCFSNLPMGDQNPMRRLEHVAENMRQLKRSRQAIVAFGLLAALGMAPAPVQETALEMFSRKATTVATNVPGPQHAAVSSPAAGSSEQMFWVPQTGSIGMGISILSYNGKQSTSG
jgi:diacylglycerol O-acyltransferase